MTQQNTISENTWQTLVEAYRLRQSNEADLEIQTDPSDLPDISVEIMTTHVLHKEKFPSRLRVTTIAE